MMGIVFEEFFEYVRINHSEDMVDDIIVGSKISNDGAFTSVGRYELEDLVSLITAYSEKTGISIENTIHDFGVYIFPRLYEGHKQYLPDWKSSLDVFRKIDGHIHVEVKKLYANAELPVFKVEEDKKNKMVLLYSSIKPLAVLAEGIIKGCIAHFNDPLTVEHTTLEMDKNRYQARFTILRSEA